MKSILSIFATMALVAIFSQQSQASGCTYTGKQFYYGLTVEYYGPGGNRYTTCSYYKKDAKANWYYRCVDGSNGYMDRNDDEGPLYHSRAGKCKHLGLF